MDYFLTSYNLVRWTRLLLGPFIEFPLADTMFLPLPKLPPTLLQWSSRLEGFFFFFWAQIQNSIAKEIPNTTNPG